MYQVIELEELAKAIPVTILTGFLGSGKTTVLNRLLAHPSMNNCMVLINEFGEVGIDHLLVERLDQDVVLLESGCICCTIRGELAVTLIDLAARRDAGVVPAFDRVLMETTGLADPAPILQILMSDRALLPDYRVDGVVCVVDAENGCDTLDAHPVSVKQAALADRLLVSKLDIAAPARAAALRARLAGLNPRAAAIPVLHGEIDPARIVDLGSLTSLGADAERDDGPATDVHRCGPDCRDHDHAHHHAHGHDHDQATHSPGTLHGEDGIASFVVTREQPVMLQKVEQALQTLAAAHRERMLRIKGIVNAEGRPVVIQGVQHLFHPPVLLPDWPSGDHHTRLVFIVHDIDPSVVHAALADI